jgi:hypothetical protein
MRPNPNLEDQSLEFMSPWGRVAQLYPWALGRSGTSGAPLLIPTNVDSWNLILLKALIESMQDYVQSIIYNSVSQTCSMEEPLTYISISRGTPTYENVYRPQKIDIGESKSITARLLSRKFYVKMLYFLYIFHDFSRNPWRCSVEPRGSWEPWFGITDSRFHGMLKNPTCMKEILRRQNSPLISSPKFLLLCC